MSEDSFNMGNIAADIHEVSYATTKYISFNIEKELVGIDIKRISEIYPLPEITMVPNAPDYVKGVINIRGKVIPVVSLRSKLMLPEKDYDEDTKIIEVFDETGSEVGIIVDKIDKVTEVKDSLVEPPPAIMGEIEGKFIKGVAKLENNNLLVLINLSKVLIKQD